MKDPGPGYVNLQSIAKLYTPKSGRGGDEGEEMVYISNIRIIEHEALLFNAENRLVPLISYKLQ